MFGKRAPPAVEHAPGSYAAVHAKFAQYHQLPGNCNAHAFTLLLGLLGTAGLIIRGCVSLSKDKPRASFARAAAASVRAIGVRVALASRNPIFFICHENFVANLRFAPSLSSSLACLLR